MLIWKRYPALYVALLVLIGVSSAFFLPLISFTLFFKKRLFWIIPLLTLLYVKLLYPSLPKEDLGRAHFHIEEIKRHPGPVKTTFCYSGTIKTFEGEKGTYYHLPARLYLPLNQKHLPANIDYLITGTLTEISKGLYILKPARKTSWIPIEKTKSRAEWRYEKKQSVKKWIDSRFKDKKVALLLSALATGHLENRYLAYKFNAVGLQHLLAISGFHFALLSFFLAFFLKRFLPEKLLALSLILLLTTYFFYMGAAPSISRAWIGVLIYLIGLLFRYRPTPLNALGVALLVALLFDPLIILHIGFQLSFGATLGILLFYRPIEISLHKLFPKRPYLQLLSMSRLDQCGYLFCTYLRSVLALQGAVLTFTLPLLLFHFQTFPLASLFYNLFFPLLFSILLALFLLHLDFLTAPFATFLITLVENAPKKLLFSISPVQTLLLALPFILCLGIKKGSKIKFWIPDKPKNFRRLFLSFFKGRVW
ncbi:MAG: ComEC/Rec2 family competence protein [Simkaniaceae bacterium]|nr:MAG: ComEC/Rec2 family competence protein [Simkaniaceae bacterium]